MRKALIILFLFPLSLWGQWTACWLFENDSTDETGTYDMTRYNGVLYSNTAGYFNQGSYSANFNSANRRMTAATTTDLTGTGGMTIAFTFRVGTGTGSAVAITNRPTVGAKGFSIEIDKTNARVLVETDDGFAELTASSLNSSYTVNTLTHVVVRWYDRDGANVTIWINGVRSGTDTTATSGFSQNDNISLGSFEDSNNDLYGYLDKTEIYKFAATDAQIDSLYDGSTDGTFYITEATEDSEPEPEPTQEDVTKGVQILSHNQYMVTYDSARNDDYVGIFDPWFPTYDTASGSWSFEFVDDEGGIYDINASSGLVTIYNHIPLESGIDTLIVKTWCGTLYENDTIFVTVADSAMCVFVSPGYSGTENGRRDTPYNSWADVTWTRGKYYFQRRGTIYSNATVIPTSTVDNFTIATYGTGARPIINAGGSRDGFTIQNDSVKIFEYYFYSNLYGIQFETSSTPKPIRCMVSDCQFSNNIQNGALYIKKDSDTPTQNDFYHQMYDIIANNNGEHGIKIEGSYCTLRNAKTYSNGDHGVSMPSWGTGNDISGVLTYSNSSSGIEVEGTGHDVYYNVSRNNYRNIDVGGGDCLIRNNYIYDANTGDNIYINVPVIEIPGLGSGITIQDNIIDLTDSYADNIFVSGYVRNLTIQRNTISNSQEYGISLFSGWIDTVNISYNVFYGNSIFDVYVRTADTMWIYNNTATGNFSLSGVAIDSVYNNIYGNIIGTPYGQENNIDIDTISTDDYFVDYANNDFRLKYTAFGARNQATDWGQTYDYYLQSKSGSEWDIGFFEYQELTEGTTRYISIGNKNRVLYINRKRTIKK